MIRWFEPACSLFFVLAVGIAYSLDLEPWWLDLGVFAIIWIGADLFSERMNKRRLRRV